MKQRVTTSKGEIMTRLNPNGYPQRPGKFFIMFQRKILRTIDPLKLMKERREFRLPVRFIGQWETLSGIISRIIEFPDGKVIILKSNRSSLLKNWPEVEIWIPQEGPAGVLQ